MSRIQFLRYWSVTVGTMDAVIGLLLIFVPGLVLDLLKIPLPSPEALDFLSWIGVFVLSVGLSYGLALGRRSRGETVWVFTAAVRLMVAFFLTCKIMTGSMLPAWALVGFVDGLVGCVQIAIVRGGWWKEARK